MSNVGLQQSQNLSLQTTITPQMQQSLQILQVPAMELQQLIEKEMLENPTLEDDVQETSPDEDSSEDTREEREQDQDQEDREFEQEFEELARMDDDWREHLIQTKRAASGSSDDDEKQAYLMESLTMPETLQEHLMRQLGLSTTTEEVHRATELLIGMVDDRGFLTSTIEDIALVERLPIEPLEIGRNLLHSFDPA